MAEDLNGPLREHLFGDGPKRILALDGGGLRGALTISFLEKIEKLLRDRHDNPKLVLSDYFDLIGGTSTGSIIAVALALGWDVASVKDMYHRLGQDVFPKSWLRWGFLRPRYAAGPLRSVLEGKLEGITLGSSELRTGLAVICKRMDTGSPWVMHNNPNGPYYNKATGKDWIANSKFPLATLVRASTAAPTFFSPEPIEVGNEEALANGRNPIGWFVDGGVSPHNNPALQLLLCARLDGFKLDWPLGAEKLLLVSVGTGSFEAPQLSWWSRRIAALTGVGALTSLMDDATWLNQTMLQFMSDPRKPWKIDGEIRCLSGEFLADRPLFSYARYDVNFSPDWLKDNFDEEIPQKEIDRLRAMDNPKLIKRLAELGKLAATKQVETEDFPCCFDLKKDTLTPS